MEAGSLIWPEYGTAAGKPAAEAAITLPFAGAARAPQAVSGAPAIAPAPAPATLAATTEPDAAVWWRLRAARIDNILVWVVLLAAVAILQIPPNTADGVIALFSLHWGLQFAYHFVLEIRDGQTVGKRRYGVRVVKLDGSRPSTGAIALRSVFRAVDAFPGFYPSGLFCMWQTGRSRRQRIGDVVAGTTVVRVEGAQRRMAASRRTLPAVAILSLALSAVGVVAVLTKAQPGPKQTEAAVEQACFNNSTGREDCRCFYEVMRDRAGYDTYDKWASLSRRLEIARETGDQSGIPPAYSAALVACRIG